MSNLKQYIKEIIEELEEMSVAGSIGGVITPLGSGPSGKVRYKSSKSSDKKLRSKSKRSIQYILKHGPSKKKRINEAVLVLTEGRTSRLDALSPDEVVAFLNYLKSEVNENTTFSVSEKISGQNTTIGVEGTSKGRNKVYAATKDSLDASGGNVFIPKYFRSPGASRMVKNCFIYNYPKLQPGEKKEFGIEIIKQDFNKPDYIAYKLKRKTIYAAVFMGDFTESDAKRMSITHRGTTIKFLSPTQIQRSPKLKDSLNPEIIAEIDRLILQVQSFSGKGIKKYIKAEIAPKVRSIINSVFGGSLLNPESPIEGLAVNMQRDDDNLFFKVPTSQFDSIQKIQASLYAEFKINRSGQQLTRPDLFGKFSDPFGNSVRANMVYDFFNQVEGQNKRSFGFYLVNFIVQMTEIDHAPNTRVFLNPSNFEILCKKLMEAYTQDNPDKYYSAIQFLGSKIPANRNKFYWHTITGSEDYNTPLAQQIKNLNLI